MKISNIQVMNFRCLYDIDLPFENLTALVGRNGTGKSSILKAIAVFYDISYSTTIEDYCDRNTDLPIEIKVTFEDFTPLEVDIFEHYIDNDQLTVTKRIEWDDDKGDSAYYATTNQIPQFAEIRRAQNCLIIHCFRSFNRTILDKTTFSIPFS